MEFSVISGNLRDRITDCLVIGVNTNGESSIDYTLPIEVKEMISQSFDEKFFNGKEGSLWSISIAKRPFFCRHLLLVGIGDKGNSLTNYKHHKLTNAVYKKLCELHASDTTIVVNDFLLGRTNYQTIKTIIEEFSYHDYAYEQYKRSNSHHEISCLTFFTEDYTSEIALKHGQILQSAVCYARELSNTPANIATPAYLAEEAKILAEQYNKIKTNILSWDELEELHMDAYLAVCRGSRHQPQLCVMEYNGGDDAPIVIIGKGITFDSGGLSLKPSQNLDEMKFDKCGACVVIALMQAIAELNLKINVIGIAATGENMPDGNSCHPGDIIVARNGTSIEVKNTDAEGRLLLADTICFAKDKFRPKTIIDIATLTGGCIVALGHQSSGLITNNEELAMSLHRASMISHDKIWRLPLDDEYQTLIEGDFADITNSAGKEASPITAGAFLNRFVGKTNWAHLDIAGPAWNMKTDKGATGRPLPLLFQYLLTEAGANME